mmetsp:Transcript_22428/g.62575  ORF Transcript_22428/g.62575 Transcript_22428/m.62575 type:complete len:105 (-) Transcript_22428:313-627(-)
MVVGRTSADRSNVSEHTDQEESACGSKTDEEATNNQGGTYYYYTREEEESVRNINQCMRRCKCERETIPLQSEEAAVCEFGGKRRKTVRDAEHHRCNVAEWWTC